MKILGIIPARAGSKRLPGKNMRPLLGKPLVEWAIQAALAARRIDRLVVSSDDLAVLELAKHYRAELALPRPRELATDTSLAIDYVRHALATLESSGESRFDAVAIIQPSSPLTTSTDIDGTIGLFEECAAESAVSVMELDFAMHPLKMKVMQGDRLLPYLEDEAGRMANHQLPTIYVRNGAVYVTRRNVLEQGRILGIDCRGYVMPRERSVDINDRRDYLLAEFLATHATERDAV